MLKVNFYFDGFNLYEGICETQDKRLLWLDIPKLVRDLLLEDEELGEIKYFTAPPTGDRARLSRYNLFIKLLNTICPSIKIVEGTYTEKNIHCNTCRGKFKCEKCKKEYKRSVEKKSDVALSVNMISDAYKGVCKGFYLVSGDTDQVPTLAKIKDMSNRRIRVVFPPNRHNDEFRKFCSKDNIIRLNHDWLEKYILPQVMKAYDSKELIMPNTWSDLRNHTK